MFDRGLPPRPGGTVCDVGICQRFQMRNRASAMTSTQSPCGTPALY